MSKRFVSLDHNKELLSESVLEPIMEDEDMHIPSVKLPKHSSKSNHAIPKAS